jgi:hypothetical protein
MNLTNVNKITNADLIAGIDNSKTDSLVFSINKEQRKVVLSKEGEKIQLTRNRSEAKGTLYYEELQEGIFDEINNILDANRLLAKGNHQFILGAALYYRIYSERQHISFNLETYELLAKTGAVDIYAPFLFWLTKLPPIKIVNILFELYTQAKSPNINNLIKIILILGNEAEGIFSPMFQERYKKVIQKPDFYYTFQEQLKSKNTNLILRALKASSNKILIENYKYGQLLKDTSIPLKMLSHECLKVFKGMTTQRGLTRELDFLAYGQNLSENKQVIEELKKRVSSFQLQSGLAT